MTRPLRPRPEALIRPTKDPEADFEVAIKVMWVDEGHAYFFPGQALVDVTVDKTLGPKFVLHVPLLDLEPGELLDLPRPLQGDGRLRAEVLLSQLGQKETISLSRAPGYLHDVTSVRLPFQTQEQMAVWWDQNGALYEKLQRVFDAGFDEALLVGWGRHERAVLEADGPRLSTEELAHEWMQANEDLFTTFGRLRDEVLASAVAEEVTPAQALPAFKQGFEAGLAKWFQQHED